MIDLNKNGKDDVQEVADGIKQFITDAEALNAKALVQDVEDAGVWLKKEIDGLSEEAQSFFSASIAKAKLESGSLGEQVADTLTLLFNDGLHAAVGLTQEASTQLKALSSQAVTAAVGLLTSKPE